MRHSSSRQSSRQGGSSRRSKESKSSSSSRNSSSRRSNRSRDSGRRSTRSYREEDDYDDDYDEELDRLKRRNRLIIAVVALGLSLALRTQGHTVADKNPKLSYASPTFRTTANNNANDHDVDVDLQETYNQKKKEHPQPKDQLSTVQQTLQHQEQLAVKDGDIRQPPQPNLRKKRWNPCLNTKYELERHDHEQRHGDLCRAKGGMMAIYECPEGCHETAGNPPYCANDESKGSATIGDKGGPCRVRDPDAPPEYRCDLGSVCVLAVGTPKEQFKVEGKYYDDTCDNECGNGRLGELTPWVVEGGICASDYDCSLSGVCTAEGKCQCDHWAEGADCSYLRFHPVDKSKLGYLHEYHSSWGGSIVTKSTTGQYHMYLSEILCKTENGKRCGLNNWETHSRIAQAVSSDIEGPYQRLDNVVLHPEHHNPSVHVSPVTGHWHLFTISGPTGPIERMISTDEGQTWGNPITISPRQNPGPFIKEDGTTSLFYRADGLDVPYPTCSDEGIAVQQCPSDNGPCNEPNDELLFGHTGEDPSVFRDHRGYYHMLFNALPYKCVPKFQQGGHAWSLDGIKWSTPRIGAFNTTIQFTDGSGMTCERRERPQMVLDKDKKPIALVTGMTGCPRALGEDESSYNGFGRFYRGADDCFTLIQKMGSSV